MSEITVGQVAALILSIVGVLKGVDYLWDKFVVPKDNLKNDVEQIKKDISDVNSKLTKDFQRFESHEARIMVLEDSVKKSEEDREDIHSLSYTLLIAVRALLKHGIDNNNTDAMRSASKEIDNYLEGKVR